MRSLGILINPGRLYTSVTVQSRSDSRNAHGQPSGPWSSFSSWKVHIEYMNASEEIEGARETVFNKVAMTGRYISGLTEKMRITWGSDIYDIISIELVGSRNRYHRVVAEKIK